MEQANAVGEIQQQNMTVSQFTITLLSKGYPKTCAN